MLSPIAEIEQSPDDVLDWGLSWAANGWLPEGDTVTTAVWSCVEATGEENPAELVVAAGTIVNDVETWTRFSGGTSGLDYYAIVLVTTSAGEVAQRSILVMVR